MSPEQSALIDEYAARIVATWKPLTAEQAEKAARILATVEPRNGLLAGPDAREKS